MKCPNCHYPKSIVLTSRPQEEWVYRRRKCPKCGWRWTTEEVTINPNERWSEMRRAWMRKLISSRTPQERKHYAAIGGAAYKEKAKKQNI